MTRVALGVAALVAGLSGCASPAKEISFDPQTGSGVVAIPANSDAWPTYNRQQALALIQQRVGPNFDIVEEGQVVTGKQTVNSQHAAGDQAVGTTTTTDVTEYRIAYRKLPGGQATPAQAGRGPLPGMPAAPGGVRPAQHVQGAGAAAGVHAAGGIVPSVAPNGGVHAAGGFAR